MSYKIRRIARSRDKRAEIMLHEVIVQSDVLPLHAETHRITGTDPILPSDIGAETPAGAQAKADAAEARAKAYTDQTIPSGIITMWSGHINEIPEGWVLCDGQNGTPDLRDRFIVGAGKSYNVGDTGGANSVTLTVDNLPAHSHTMGSAGSHSHTGSTNSTGSHTHTYPTGWGVSGSYFTLIDTKNKGSGQASSASGTHSHSLSINSAGSHTHTINNTGGGKAHENRPPYYALAFIMKI